MEDKEVTCLMDMLDSTYQTIINAHVCLECFSEYQVEKKMAQMCIMVDDIEKHILRYNK